MRRPVRVGLATLLAAVLLLLVGAGVPPPAAAADPFALPDQITDQIAAVQAETASIRAALDTLETEHGVRMWVVFVDSFDGTDPQRWADQTFAATGLGPSDYLLAVAMGDRQYGYVVDEDFVLSDAALDRVAIAAERHLAENPARAVTVAAQAIADEITGNARPAPSSSGTSDSSSSDDGFIILLLAGSVLFVVVNGILRVRHGLPFFKPSTGHDDHWTGSGLGGGSSSGGGGGTRGGSGSF